MKYLRRILPGKIKIWIGKILLYRPKPPVLRPRRSNRSTLKTRPRKRRTRKAVVAAAAIVGVLTFVVWRNFLSPLPVYYVAYLGRDRPFFDEFHQHAIQKHLRELNSNLPDKRIELKLFSNHQTEAGSRQAYEEILKDPRILAVIDNTWGKELQSVSDLIAQNNLAVISMNADKGDKNFNNHVVFMGYDDDVPTKVIAFSRKILNVTHVIFVTEQDYKLSDVFIQEFKNAGTTTVPLYVGDFRAASKLDKDNLLRDVDAQIADCQKDQACTPTVMLNTHGSWGNEIIKHIDAGRHGVTILGASSIVDWANYDRPFGLNQNKNKLIIFTYPHDSVISKVYNDLKEIKIDGVELGRPNELLFVKRSLDAVSIIRGALVDDLTWRSRGGLSREGFVDFFNNRLASNRHIGPHDLYVFDHDLRLADERSFEEYSEGQTFSYEKQLDAKNNPIPTVYFELSQIVVPGIDPKTRTFHAQFVLWVSSDQPGAEKNIHFPNARAGLKMERLPESTQDNAQAELSRGDSSRRRSRAFKVSSEFSMIGDTANYPFDSQELAIEIAATGNNPRLSFDLSTLGKDSLGEWTCGEPYVTKDHHIVRSPISTADREKRRAEKYQTVNLRVPIQRRWREPFVTIIVPLFMIAVAAIALLYIRDGSFSSQGQICIAIFLALITYSIPFEGMVPRSGAVTVADKMFYGTFLTVLAVFLKVCFVNSMLISSSLKKRLSSRSMLVGNVALASYCGTVIWILVQAFALAG